MDQPEASIAQILHGSRPIGLAFVVGERHLLTCAHVVNVALGRDRRAPDRPPGDSRLLVQFPLVGNDRDPPLRRVAVDAWYPIAGEFDRRDVAGLVITADGVPDGVAPLTLVGLDSVADRQVQMWGPSSERPTGGHVVGELMGAVEPGRVQVDQTIRGAFQARSGFSGGPVWLRATGHLVGMVTATATDSDATDVYVIDSGVLVAAWPDVLFRPPPCPYRGLDSFDEMDSHLFFGRAAFVDRFAAALRGVRVFAVIGPSGCGKTSVLHAGLIPRQRAEVPSLVIRMQPGRKPVEALAAQMAAAAAEPSDRLPVVELEAWTRRLRDEGLASCADTLAASFDVARVVVVVDQFEQVLTRCDPAERKRFLDLLADHTEDEESSHLVVAGIRDDHFGPVLVECPRLAEYLRTRFLVLGEMSREELVEAIRKPAEIADPAHPVTFDEGLIDQIVDDFRGRPAELPLLEFALTQLWERQRNGALTLAAYRAAGGVAEALAKYADQQIDTLSVREQASARRVLTRLAMPGSRDVGRAVARDELSAADWTVVAKLESARLVGTRRDSEDTELVEIAHEALLRGWARLRSWLHEDREVLAWTETVRSAEATWESEDRHPSLLLRGPVLARAEQMLVTFPERAEHLRAFIEESRRSEDEEERQRRNLLLRSEALRLAVHAELARVSVARGYLVGLVLGIESLRRLPTFEGDNALRRTLAKAGVPRARLRHDRSVSAVVFSPDGGSLLTASADGTARLWDAGSGAELVRFGHDNSVSAVAFSPDGERLATASADGTARLWDAGSGAELMRFGHNSSVSAVAFSPDGERLATASADNTARVWDIAGAAEVARLAHNNSVNSVRFSPDGTRAVTAADDNTARIWDTTSGAELARLRHDRWVSAAAFSPDGTRVATASVDGTARVWDAVSGAELARLTHGGSISAVVFSAGGGRVVTASADGTARVWDAISGAELTRLAHGGSVSAVAFSPDGHEIMTASADNTARIWNAGTGAELTRLTHDGWVSAVAFSPDGTKVATTADHDTTARLWDAGSGAELIRLGHDNAVNAIGFRPGGDVIATAADDCTARLWDAAKGTELACLEHGGAVSAVVFSPDGTKVATANGDHTARLWEAPSGAPLGCFEHGSSVNAVAFSPDGTRIATASVDNTARVWDAASGAELARLDHDGWVNAVAFNPDGTRIATAADDGTARIWNIREDSQAVRDDGEADRDDGEAVRLVHGNSVNSVVFSLDGATLVTASADGTGRVWDAMSGAELARLGHDGWVSGAAFSPDGTRIATASVDNTARVWDAASGAELARLSHDGWVNAVAFSPDGTTLATASADLTSRIWPLLPDALIEQARARLTRNMSRVEWRRYLFDEAYHKLRDDLP